jgi:hypothetical protein
VEQIGLWCNDGRLLQVKSPECKRGNGIILERTRGRGVADLVTVGCRVRVHQLGGHDRVQC